MKIKLFFVFYVFYLCFLKKNIKIILVEKTTRLIKGRYNHLKISDIRIRLANKEDAKLKAFASLTVEDSLVIHDIRVIDGKNGLFISMPNKKTPDGEYKDIVHPKDTQTREEMKDAILKAYEEALNSTEA